MIAAQRDFLMRFLGSYLRPGSPYRGLVMAVSALVVLSFMRRAIRAPLARYVQAQALRKGNADVFLITFDRVFTAVSAIVVIVAASASFRLLGLTIALLGTMLGWALQVPIRGLAAWVMVSLTRPFRVGDRIRVANVTGDVLDIQLNHILLNQVGGTVQGEEPSGRGIFVPNAILFGEEIINYNYFEREAGVPDAPKGLMLDEVPVRITFGSDYALATRLCVDAARRAVAELMGASDEEPFTRVEFMPWGVLLRVRYRTVPVKRQEVSSRVTELIWAAFREHEDAVKFCLPSSTADVLRQPGGDKPPMSTGMELD